MQQVKDSFYMALRDRLCAANMADAIDLVVVENSREMWLGEPGKIYLRWSEEPKVPIDALAAGWHALHCEMGYRVAGSDVANGEDRGRQLAVLDRLLGSVIEPRKTRLLDFSQTPAADLSKFILWAKPALDVVKETAADIQRPVHLNVLWQEEESA